MRGLGGSTTWRYGVCRRLGTRVAEARGGDDRTTTEAKMSARTSTLFLAASLALAPALALSQDHAVPRGGGSGGGGGGGGSHPSPGVQSNSGGSYSGGSGGSSSTPPPSGTSTAQRRHPRAGTGTGSGGGYYPGYPGYGWGGYYPGYGYGSYWWPYGSFGWYGGYWGGYPGWYDGGHGSGSLRVLVDPAEARVYVDGYYAGAVDDFDGLFQRLQVAPGRHEITCKLEGYKTYRVRVYVGPDATLKLHHEMEKGQGESFEDLTGGAPLPEREVRRERDDQRDDQGVELEGPASGAGQLRLSVLPEDASIYVDGAFRGTAREAGSLKLAPGRHRIEVVRPGYKTADKEVEVAPGETTRLTLTLDRPSI
jgi:hypothetical protein